MRDGEVWERRVARRELTLGVVGLGYVGLPLAASFAATGFSVLGVDRDPKRVDALNRGEMALGGEEPDLSQRIQAGVQAGRLRATANITELAAADVVFLAVETPVDTDHLPRWEALRTACQAVGAVMRPGTLVVVESTVGPGICDTWVVETLEKASGLRRNEGFFWGHCPERVMPGRLLENLRTMPRVCGGGDLETAQGMKCLYATVVDAEIDTTDCVTAELVKTGENTFRDLQLAFSNGLAQACEQLGADFRAVRKLINRSPGRNVLWAGAGVGGHCIPKDPWLLAHAIQDSALYPLIEAARAINQGMPAHMLCLTQEALHTVGRSLAGATLAVLGMAYRENTSDVRNSPSAALLALAESQGAQAVVHDPWVPPYATDLFSVVQNADAVLVMVAHTAYLALDWAAVRACMRTPVLIDGRFCIDQAEAVAAGFVFRAVGQSAQEGPHFVAQSW